MIGRNRVRRSLVAELVAFVDLPAILPTEDIIEIDFSSKRFELFMVEPLFWCFTSRPVDVAGVVPIDPVPERRISSFEVSNLFPIKLADHPFLNEPEQPLDLALALRLKWLMRHVGDPNVPAGSGDLTLILALPMVLVDTAVVADHLEKAGIIRIQYPKRSIVFDHVPDHAHVVPSAILTEELGGHNVAGVVIEEQDEAKPSSSEPVAPGRVHLHKIAGALGFEALTNYWWRRWVIKKIG